MRHKMFVGETPRKLFGTWTIPQLQLLKSANQYMVSRGIPIGTECRIEFADDTLMIMKKDNSLHL